MSRVLDRPTGALLGGVVRTGMLFQQRTGRTPAVSYAAMRRLFGVGDGKQFDRLAAATRTSAPLQLHASSGLLADAEVRAKALAELRADGVTVLANGLPESHCDALQRLAESAECVLYGRWPDAPQRGVFPPSAPVAAKYEVPELDLARCEAAQAIVADESLLALAQDYFGATPINDLLTMWWSAPGPTGSESEVAQQFHFDLDRLRFLKLFVYLTDVTEESGPHVYLRGTHHGLPARLRAPRRYTDSEVGSELMSRALRLCGPRGTMFLADTIGLHKGLPVVEGNRLVF
ncbi:MAG: phytanoyl-CoA dioxygenase family protein, partial [Acidimicrobiales bacterium]